MKWNARNEITLVLREFALLKGTPHHQLLSLYQFQLPCQPIELGRSYCAGQKKLAHKLMALHKKLLRISCCGLCVIWTLWYCYEPISHSVESMGELWCSRKDRLGYILWKRKYFRVQEKGRNNLTKRLIFATGQHLEKEWMRINFNVVISTPINLKSLLKSKMNRASGTWNYLLIQIKETEDLHPMILNQTKMIIVSKRETSAVRVEWKNGEL